MNASFRKKYGKHVPTPNASIPGFPSDFILLGSSSLMLVLPVANETGWFKLDDGRAHGVAGGGQGGIPRP